MSNPDVASMEIILVQNRFDKRWFAGFSEAGDMPMELSDKVKLAVLNTLKQYNDENH